MIHFTLGYFQLVFMSFKPMQDVITRLFAFSNELDLATVFVALIVTVTIA